MRTRVSNLKMLADYQERKRALLDDGYRLRHETWLGHGVIARLCHKSNGHDIILSAIGMTLTQKSNGTIVHQHTYEDN